MQEARTIAWLGGDLTVGGLSCFRRCGRFLHGHGEPTCCHAGPDDRPPTTCPFRNDCLPHGFLPSAWAAEKSLLSGQKVHSTRLLAARILCKRCPQGCTVEIVTAQIHHRLNHARAQRLRKTLPPGKPLLAHHNRLQGSHDTLAAPQK